MIKPRAPAPTLELPLVSGEQWRLAAQEPEAYSLVVFYRGLHCPVCRGYLRQLDTMLDEFAAAGVTAVVAVSGDDRDRAEQTVESWKVTRLPVAYGQTTASMRDWGLFVSKGFKEGEPDEFAEPGLFLIHPDGHLVRRHHQHNAVRPAPFRRRPRRCALRARTRLPGPW